MKITKLDTQHSKHTKVNITHHGILTWYYNGDNTTRTYFRKWGRNIGLDKWTDTDKHTGRINYYI